MDSRDTRRAAEKAARALLAARAAVVGDLAVAHTSRARAAELLTATAAQGQALIDAAHAEAAQMLADAQTIVDDAHAAYATAHAAALQAGWQPGELTALGYAGPTSRRARRRASTPTDVPAPCSDPDHEVLAPGTGSKLAPTS